jgi:acetyl/propionyl-CoA carboxylase alpha subunit
MVRAIDEYKITGITTTLGFGKFVMQHEAFASGNFDTHFVQKYFTPEVLQQDNEEEAFIAAMVMDKLLSGKRAVASPAISTVESSNWVKNRKQN